MSKSVFIVVIALSFVVLVFSASFCGGVPRVRAQQMPPSASTLSELALRVARVAVNEGAFKHRYEAALVWQTTRNNGVNTSKRLSWLKRHSPRVNGTRECKVGNCFWTPNLERSTTLPAGLVLPLDYWTLRVAPIWTDTLRYVDWMVTGDRATEDPCHVQPRTWGCEADRKRALAQGLYPVGCRRPKGADDGFAQARDCWRGRWLCDPRFEPSIESEPPSPLDMSIARRSVSVLH